MPRIDDLTWDDDGKIEVLTFDLGCATFAIEAGLVREILDPLRETRVPGCPKQIGSIVNYRGRLIPLVDLRPAFHQALTPSTADSRFVVIECSFLQPVPLLAFRADRVHEVVVIEKRQIEDVPPSGIDIDPTQLRGMINCGEDFFLMPDIPALLSTLSRHTTDQSSSRGMPCR